MSMWCNQSRVRPSAHIAYQNAVMVTPGERIKKAREEKGYGLREFARMAGMSASTLMSLEKGESKLPSLERAIRMAELLGKTVGWIVDGKDGAKAASKEQQELLDAVSGLSNDQLIALIAVAKSIRGPQQD